MVEHRLRVAAVGARNSTATMDVPFDRSAALDFKRRYSGNVFCPQAYGGCGEPLSIKVGQVRVPHLSHLPGSTCTLGASGSAAEHAYIQHQIVIWARDQGASACTEHRVEAVGHGRGRTDIRIEHGGTAYHVEVQRSPIAWSEMLRRTSIYQSTAQRVAWLLGPAVLRESNRDSGLEAFDLLLDHETSQVIIGCPWGLTHRLTDLRLDPSTTFMPRDPTARRFLLDSLARGLRTLDDRIGAPPVVNMNHSRPGRRIQRLTVTAQSRRLGMIVNEVGDLVCWRCARPAHMPAVAQVCEDCLPAEMLPDDPLGHIHDYVLSSAGIATVAQVLAAQREEREYAWRYQWRHRRWGWNQTRALM